MIPTGHKMQNKCREWATGRRCIEMKYSAQGEHRVFGEEDIRIYMDVTKDGRHKSNARLI